MRKLFLFIALLVGVATYGQNDLRIVVEPENPSIEDNVKVIVRSSPMGGDCSYKRDSVEIENYNVMINAKYNTQVKCMRNGINDTVLLGQIPKGKYSIDFTLIDEDSLYNMNSHFAFEVVEVATPINQQSAVSNAVLYQNSPNPFNNQTEIKYNLPENAENAAINVYSLNGNMLLSKPLTKTGNGSITISGSELEAGMYIYTLAVNGIEADSKRMIITDK